MQKILIADDEFKIRKLVKDFLIRSNYEVLEAENGYEAIEILKANPDTSLIILDIMMPVMDGWSACAEIRKFSDVHIVFLTAKETEEDQLKGYALGVDEYITKPFSPKILVAKIDAILTRNINTSKANSGLIKIDEAQRSVYVNGNLLDLSFKEFELMVYFVKHKNVALSREKLIREVWNYGGEYFGDTRIIDTHIKNLRQKLGEVGDNIKTIRGFGYKFEI